MDRTASANRREVSPAWSCRWARGGRGQRSGPTLQWLGILLAIGAAGCSVVPRSRLEQAHNYNRDLEERLQRVKDQSVSRERETARRQQEISCLEDRLAGQQQVQAILEQRLANLRRENKELHTELTGLVISSTAGGERRIGWTKVNSASYLDFKLPADLAPRLLEFAKRHPGVSFELSERACRFQSDLAFAGGGDRLQPQARAALAELARILNSPAARELNLLIVGHTAQEPPLPPALLRQHPTEWHRAAHQAIAVEQHLEEAGLSPTRMGIISYADQQPLAGDGTARENARLEIFLLPPDPPAQ